MYYRAKKDSDLGCIMVKITPATSDRPTNWNQSVGVFSGVCTYVLHNRCLAPGAGQTKNYRGISIFFLCFFACEEQRTATERVKADNPNFSACVCVCACEEAIRDDACRSPNKTGCSRSFTRREFVSAEKMREFCLKKEKEVRPSVREKERPKRDTASSKQRSHLLTTCD